MDGCLNPFESVVVVAYVRTSVVVLSGQTIAPVCCIAKSVTAVMPPMAVDTGSMHMLITPQAMIHTRQPDTAPVVADFTVSPFVTIIRLNRKFVR